MCNKLNKLATILDKPNQGGHRWKRIQKNMKKKLIKMGKQNNYFLCIHPDELTTRMLLIPIIRMLIKTISCLDNKENNPTPPEPQPSSSNTTENKEKEKEENSLNTSQNRKRRRKRKTTESEISLIQHSNIPKQALSQPH